MANRIFNQVPGGKVKRNAFNLSHERKLSLDMGKLVPIMCTEVVPGDTFRVNSEIMLRFAPMFFPVMHRIDVYVHYFFVPNRIIWNEWEDFITGGEDGKAAPIFPRVRITKASFETWNNMHGGPGSLGDYLGIPTMREPATENTEYEFSILPYRAYAKIYDEYYRDQDLIEPLNMYNGSGVITQSNMNTIPVLQNRCWEKDYFTSARPWAQKGESVTIPMAGTGEADVTISDDLSSAPQSYWRGQNSSGYPDGNLFTGSGGNTRAGDEELNSGVWYDPNGSLKVDFTKANFTAATINELRRAFQLQKWMERNARSGSRYTEVLRAHFGVKSSDARLQRPEYLGGGRQKVSISEVLQTSETSENSPQGEMAGHGISIGSSNRFKAFFEEHGYVMGIMSVLPRTAYQQGLPKHFQKFDRFDYYWREFAHIGEQEIKSSELYFSTGQGSNESTFGYAPRYADYKYLPSTVHGDMKSTLIAWHLGRTFSSRPELNEEFVKANPSTRIFNVEGDYHHLWAHVYNNVKAIRPMPVFGEPGLIDH